MLSRFSLEFLNNVDTLSLAQRVHRTENCRVHISLVAYRNVLADSSTSKALTVHMLNAQLRTVYNVYCRQVQTSDELNELQSVLQVFVIENCIYYVCKFQLVTCYIALERGQLEVLYILFKNSTEHTIQNYILTFHVKYYQILVLYILSGKECIHIKIMSPRLQGRK